jgi:hypothetical protein
MARFQNLSSIFAIIGLLITIVLIVVGQMGIFPIGLLFILAFLAMLV